MYIFGFGVQVYIVTTCNEIQSPISPFSDTSIASEIRPSGLFTHGAVGKMAARLAPQRNFITLATLNATASPPLASNATNAVSAMSAGDQQQVAQQFGNEPQTTTDSIDAVDRTTTIAADTTATLIVMTPEMADENSGIVQEEMFEHSNGSDAGGEDELHDESEEIELIPMSGDEGHDEGDVAAMHESINEQMHQQQQQQQHEQEQRTQMVQHTMLPVSQFNVSIWNVS